MQIWTSTVVELEPFEFKKQENSTIKIINFLLQSNEIKIKDVFETLKLKFRQLEDCKK